MSAVMSVTVARGEVIADDLWTVHLLIAPSAILAGLARPLAQRSDDSLVVTLTTEQAEDLAGALEGACLEVRCESCRRVVEQPEMSACWTCMDRGH